jgi:hypothetical protein
VGSIAIAGGIAIAIAIVLVTRGSLRQLLRLRIQSIWMVVLALAIQIALEFVDFPKDRIDDLGFGLLMASYALLLAFCFVNVRVPAMPIVALGIALNALVIGLNQGMPTRDREVTTASGRTVEKPIERSVKHRPESGDDLLPFLGDKIVIPEPIDEVISVGDIVLAIGIVGVCYQGSRTRRRARRRPGVRTTERSATGGRDQIEQPEQREQAPPPPPPPPLPPPTAPRDPADDPLGVELERAQARLSDLERRRERVAGGDEEEEEDEKEDEPDEPLFRPGT